MSYSQNNEEEKIVAFFGDTKGKRFLDIGAHDGITFSNTRRLAEMGWGGTLVEPSASAFLALMNTYKERSDVQLANLAIVPARSGVIKFYDARGDFVSTFNEAHRQTWAAPGGDGRHGVPFQTIYVSPATFAELFATLPGPYSFVNLDVEGINYELFRDLRLKEIGVELICVEYQERLHDIEVHAALQGYRRLHVTSENVLLARQP